MKICLGRWMDVVGFWAMGIDRITNMWDGLINEHIEKIGSTNWLGLIEVEQMLSKTKKMSLEFNKTKYAEMAGFIGKRQIFGGFR